MFEGVERAIDRSEGIDVAIALQRSAEGQWSEDQRGRRAGTSREGFPAESWAS